VDMMAKALIAGGLVGALVVAATGPSLAQVVVKRYQASPYGGYAYVPGYRRYWDAPAGYDTSGMPYSYRELGWQGGPPGAAPANPCYPSQRAQNRC
jgi:hypothetical protein